MGVIKEHAPSRTKADEIDEVVGSTVYGAPYYFTELRDRTLGKHSADLVGVSRYYPSVKVVVDFEPLTGSFWEQQKRAFCHERGIVYVPVYRGEILRKEQFEQRFKEERKALDEAKRLQSLSGEELEKFDPDVVTAARAEAARRCDAMVAAGTLVHGAAYQRRLGELTRRLAEELQQQVENGRLGQPVSDHNTAPPAG